MKLYHINDHEVTFDPKEHQYTVDGFKVTNISKIVDEIYPRNHKNIDPDILKMAAEKGIELKHMIDNFEKQGVKTYHKEMQGYLALKTQHQFTVQAQDIVVLLYHHGAVIGAGSFDMVVESPYMKGKGLADVKRMKHINQQRLTLQLNLYKLAYEQTYKQKLHYLKCIHIRNRHHQYLDIMIDKNATTAALNRFIEKHPINHNQYV